jgi:hypothetical protein
MINNRCMHIGKLYAYLDLIEVEEHAGGEAVDLHFSKNTEFLRLLERVLNHGRNVVEDMMYNEWSIRLQA